MRQLYGRAQHACFQPVADTPPFDRAQHLLHLPMFIALLSNGSPVQHGQHDGHEATVPWWSFTKTVLSAASLSLVRDGWVGLDEPVPEGPFTLRQLLRHEAGLADYGELADYHAAVARGDAPWPVDEMLQRLDAKRLRYAPGAGWNYSNVGYIHVGRLVERVTGLVLEDALRQRVLDPLGLSGVRFARTPSELADDCAGVTSSYDPGWVYHGLLVGSLTSAALFLDGLLAGQLLPEWLLTEMKTARALGGPIPGRPWTSPGYALGLMHGPANTGMILSGHTGVGPGSVVAIYRSEYGGHTATCAAFNEGSDQGFVEAEVVHQLSAILKP